MMVALARLLLPERDGDELDAGGSSEAPGTKIAARGVNVHYRDLHALKAVSLDIAANRVTALVGPSGCGKSTFLRCLNRMIETVPHARMTGVVRLDGRNIRRRLANVSRIRARFGVVAQKPDPFPKSVYDNVAYGPRIHELARDRHALDEIVARCLRRVGLWEELEGSLHERATALSVGQQQRLCIARAIAYRPDVLLMDEPCSALGPAASARIEELIGELRRNHTIVLATHHLAQAARVSQHTAFFHLGELVEAGETAEVLANPGNALTRQYVEGRIG